MSISVADLGSLLRASSAEGSAPGERPVLSGGATTWSLVEIAPDTRWSAPESAASVERTLLVLEGHGTLEADDQRHSIGSGHLITLDAGDPCDVRNDHVSTLILLLGAREAPAPTTVPPKETP